MSAPGAGYSVMVLELRRWLTPVVALALAGCASQQAAPPPPVSEKSAPATVAAKAEPAKAETPKEVTAQPLGDADGAIAEGELCLSCHSVELMRTSRIGLAGWTAEMTKMRNWGALVDETKAAPFAGWFAQRYPVAEKEPPAALISASAAIAAVAPDREKQPVRGDPKAGATLYAKTCASCHGPEAEGLGGGPVLIEAPAIYRRQYFANLVLKGQGRMPASPGTTDAEISNLLVFLRQLH
ncbi:MAG TPA: c-type cytochrome [Myxococcaceae bacterium]|nr:c-type cytochrome [Myxococcaceae bacterium]